MWHLIDSFECENNADKFSEKLKLSQFSNLYFKMHWHMVPNSPSLLELSLFIVRHRTNDKIILIDLHVVKSSFTFFQFKNDDKSVVWITKLEQKCFFSSWSILVCKNSSCAKRFYLILFLRQTFLTNFCNFRWR